MDFLAVIQHARVALQREGRITYRTLKRQFDLDDEALDDLTYELIEGQEVAADKDGKMLVWTGSETSEHTASQTLDAPAPEHPSPIPSSQTQQEAPTSERRQLTVMFCDLVGSTALSAQLDPEELQAVVRTYQEVSAQVIERYDGYIAQYLGDGLLVYFGYPAAHEDDAARAVRAGLEIVTALHQAHHKLLQPVQVRIGIHTGPVVVGQMGGGSRHEQLALGETPNIAARVQGKARPDEVVISAATQQLVAGLFEVRDHGLHELKGIATPQPLHRVTAESAAQSRFAVAVQAGLTPLAGREHEQGVLHQRWTQAQAGAGQVVLLSGEPGIGKSRLVQELKDQTKQDGATQIAFQCSPYHQNSALYPITEHLQRLLQYTPGDTPQTKLDKLQQTLRHYRFSQPDTLPLLAALLSLPHPEGVPPLTVSPQKQKELTQMILVAWLIEETERQPVYNSWEDVHWADPSTLAVLDLLLDQVPTTRLLIVLTFRPEYVPPWGSHSYVSQLTLSRLGQPQVKAMVERMTDGKALSEEVIQQIVTKTDGVPLFVEELTKMVVESHLVHEENGRYELSRPLTPFAIPSTLQDLLRARLDRLATVREVAQLGATIGREFSYALLAAVSRLDTATLQQELQQLVNTEFLYQRGLPPQARYTFKHALIQDTAYQSLLKSTRQQYHHQIARALEQQFTEIAETQPEVVAQHYTEAGLIEQAIAYWQQAGQRAIQRSANMEAIGHLTKGLELLKTLPDTAERTQQELTLLLALGAPLQTTRGMGSPEMENVYTRARELCLQVGETPQLLPVLYGLRRFYVNRAEYQTACEIGEQFRQLAQRVEPRHLVGGHYTTELYWLGEFAETRAHLEEGVALYNRQQHHSLALVYGTDPGVVCLTYLAWTLWDLGYPEQARERVNEMLSLTQELSHSSTLAYALIGPLFLHQFCRKGHATQEQAETLIAFAGARGFPFWVPYGTMLRGWALAEQGQGAEGILQIRQGLAAYQAMGANLALTYWFGLLADAYGKTGQTEQGLNVLADALALVQKTRERRWEAELYRLKGEFLLAPQGDSLHLVGSREKAEEAEQCFLKAVEVARQQQAKSLELRTATSLAHLWQTQGKQAEAHELLAPVYNWFTEGFDTADLKDAKALLEALS